MKFSPRRASSVNGAFPISNAHRRSALRPEQVLPKRPRNPALLRLHKFRVIVLPILLVFVFTTMMLAAIYAYCVAKPHTDSADQLSSNTTAAADTSIFSRRETATIAAEATAGTKRSSSTSEADAGSELALLLYALTVPGLSIVHNIFELIMHHNTPQILSLRSIYITLLTTSFLLICGWITTIAFWMHCELPIFNQNKAGQGVCPVQVRGHFMYGIHEVSIARIAIAGIVVLAYISHVVLLALGYQTQKRMWRITGAGTAGADMEMRYGEAKVVVVRFSDESNKNDAALAKEANSNVV